MTSEADMQPEDAPESDSASEALSKAEAFLRRRRPATAVSAPTQPSAVPIPAPTPAPAPTPVSEPEPAPPAAAASTELDEVAPAAPDSPPPEPAVEPVPVHSSAPLHRHDDDVPTLTDIIPEDQLPPPEPEPLTLTDISLELDEHGRLLATSQSLADADAAFLSSMPSDELNNWTPDLPPNDDELLNEIVSANVAEALAQYHTTLARHVEEWIKLYLPSIVDEELQMARSRIVLRTYHEVHALLQPITNLEPEAPPPMPPSHTNPHG